MCFLQRVDGRLTAAFRPVTSSKLPTMLVLAAALMLTLSSCAASCSGNTHPQRQTAECDGDREAVPPQMLKARLKEPAGKAVAGSFRHGEEEEEEEGLGSSSQVLRRDRDPCFHYTVLDQAWRATNASSHSKMCDRNVRWEGWYRLFYSGLSLQMPERCVPVGRCGTHAPLWLAGPHPRRRDGVVTRNVCGHWKDKCCAFLSAPIQVKKCPGNYYVYKFTKPSTCYLAYCADVNTLVCSRCSKQEMCVSRDKINWRCQKKRKISMQVHFFASFPAQLSGKVKRIQYSSVLVNMGRAFDRRSGVFRAPVAGLYRFFFSTQASGAGLQTDLWLVVNDYWVAVSHTHLPPAATAGSLNTYMTFLTRGAVVYVTHNCGRSWANAASVTITFSGSLLVQYR